MNIEFCQGGSANGSPRGIDNVGVGINLLLISRKLPWAVLKTEVNSRYEFERIIERGFGPL